MKTDNENGVELLRRGYDEPTRCLNFRVDFYPYGNGRDCVIKAIESIGEYNYFDPNKIIPVILSLAEICPYAKIGIGRESSPVIYIQCTAKQAEFVKDAFTSAGPDEIDYDNGEVRLWWD